MSCVETHFGIIVEVKNTFSTLEEFCKYQLLKRGYAKAEGKTALATLRELQIDWEEQFFFIKNKIFILIHDQDLDPEGFTQLYDTGDGKLIYCTSFYNGGTCLEEVIEDKLINYVG